MNKHVLFSRGRTRSIGTRFDVGTSLVMVLLVTVTLFVNCPGRLDAQETVTPLIVTTPTPSIMPTPTSAPAPTSTPDPAPGIYSFASYEGDYLVQPGDTLLTVALEVGVDLEDVFCLIAPDFSRDQPLVIGDALTIPSPGVICHEVAVGDTIASIADQYEVAEQSILDEQWNQLLTPTDVLAPGAHLRVPMRLHNDAVVEIQIPISHENDQTEGLSTGVLPLLLSQPINADVGPVMAVGAAFSKGEAPPVGSPRAASMAPVPADWPFGSGHFSWPVAGWLTQGYLADHRAVDVAAPAGTMVTAADRGVILRAGWNDQGYGLFVIVDHKIDYITLYAHLGEVLVEAGDVVVAGQPLGLVGSTGNSTGPHLHFEIRDFGQRIDPLPLLIQ